VIGIALGSVLLPKLSEKKFLNNPNKMNEVLNECLKIAAILTIPATAALIIISLPLISVLFERGAFSNIDSQFTAKALVIYAVGLPAYVLHKIFTPIFFSRGDTTNPFIIAVISMLSNVVIAVSLIKYFGYLSPVISTTISSWLMAILLFQKSRSLGFRISVTLLYPCIKIFIASAVLSLILIYASFGWLQVLISSDLRGFYLFLLILFSASAYFLILWILGFFNRTSS
jgi:putative peptidoglycan lipid II flippase